MISTPRHYSPKRRAQRSADRMLTENRQQYIDANIQAIESISLFNMTSNAFTSFWALKRTRDFNRVTLYHKSSNEGQWIEATIECCICLPPSPELERCLSMYVFGTEECSVMTCPALHCTSRAALGRPAPARPLAPPATPGPL